MQMTIDKSDWKKVRLGDVATEYSKRINNPSESEFERFVGNSNIGQWDFRVESWEDTSSVTSAMKLFKVNDYLLVRRSLYASDFRERAPRAHFAGVCSGDILTIRENPNYIADGFLIGILNSPALWKFVVANASGSITRRIKWKDLANYEFFLPPKEQQAKIAELLWSFDDSVMNSQRNLKYLTSYYKALREFFSLTVERDIGLIKHTVLKANVNENVEFGLLGDYLTSIRYGTSKKSNTDNSGVGVLGIPNVINERLTLDKLAYVNLTKNEYNAASLSRGDILIVRSNGNPSYTGRSALYDLEEGHVFASYLIKISVDQNVINPEFLVRYLQTQASRRYFRRHATSSAGNYNINTETIKALPVPRFTLDYQKEVVSKLKQVEQLLLENEEYLTSSKKLLSTVIDKVF